MMRPRPVPHGRPATLAQKFRWLGCVLANPDIQTGAKALAAALFFRHNSTTGRLDPGVRGLAQLTRLSESGVRDAMKQLQAAGTIEIIQRKTYGGGNRTN